MIRKASAVWRGTGKAGKGTLSSDSGVLSATPYSFRTRFEDEKGTNPEELIAAAHASCYSMAFSSALAKAGTPPTTLETEATATFVPGEGITSMELTVRGTVEGISEEDFLAAAENAKENCPVSKALKGNVPITLNASLA